MRMPEFPEKPGIIVEFFVLHFSNL